MRDRADEPARSDAQLLDAVRELSSSVANALTVDDEQMKTALRALTTRWPMVVEGFGDLLELIDALMRAMNAAEAPYPLPQLAERTRWDLTCALCPALVGYESMVMDTARDLMEIASLAHEFTMEPQRIPKWISGADRSRQFGFGKLLRKDAERGRNVSSIEQMADEYRMHSESLHPAANENHPSALTKRPVAIEAEWWLPLAFYELLRHGLDVGIKLEVAALKLCPSTPSPVFGMLGPESVLVRAVDELRLFQASLLSSWGS